MQSDGVDQADIRAIRQSHRETVPLATFLEERRRRQKAETERDQERHDRLAIQDKLGHVLQGIKERDEAGK